MIFPLWDPLSTKQHHMISNPTCIGILNLKNNLDCTYNTTLKILFIYNSVAYDI